MRKWILPTGMALIIYALMILSHNTHLNPTGGETLTWYYGSGRQTSISLGSSCWYHELCTPYTDQEMRYREEWLNNLP